MISGFETDKPKHTAYLRILKLCQNLDTLVGYNIQTNRWAGIVRLSYNNHRKNGKVAPKKDGST
jgi:hypothetical protein